MAEWHIEGVNATLMTRNKVSQSDVNWSMLSHKMDVTCAEFVSNSRCNVSTHTRSLKMWKTWPEKCTQKSGTEQMF
jgi:hypothetical protein